MNTSIVVETYNYLEGASMEAFRASLRAAVALSRENDVEILVAEVTGDAAVKQLLVSEFPNVRCVDAVGLGYDDAKAQAAELAQGRYIVFLDGDCVPEAGWLEELTGPLRERTAVAVAGFGRYPPGFLSSVLSVMDFGFLLPRVEQDLGCYAFHNVAFVRDVLLQIPIPQGPMRCKCYAHAQRLRQAGMPVRMAPRAGVIHEQPPFFQERLRQGYDAVAVGWVDPDLREARWLRLGLAAAPKYYWRAVKFDWKRTRTAYKDVGLRSWQSVVALPLFPIFRLVDLVGILGALLVGPRGRRWFDWGFQHLQSRQ